MQGRSVDPATQCQQLLELVEVTDAATVATGAAGSHGEVTPQVAPDVDDDEHGAAPFDWLQPRGGGSHRAPHGGVHEGRVRDQVGGGGQSRTPVGVDQRQQRAADARPSQQGLRPSRERAGGAGPST